VRVRVPLVTTGKSAALAVGGRVVLVYRTLPVECDPDRIPKTLEVDVTELDVGDAVTYSQVPTPDGVRVLFDRDVPVINILGKLKELVIEAPKPVEAVPGVEGAPVEGTAAGAEGATPAAAAGPPLVDPKGKKKEED
jgi:hypothetical protein